MIKLQIGHFVYSDKIKINITLELITFILNLNTRTHMNLKQDIVYLLQGIPLNKGHFSSRENYVCPSPFE